MAQQEVIRALHALSSGSNDERRGADKWLTAWRDSCDPLCWDTAFSLFRDPSQTPYVHHFMALCLHHFTRSRRHWKLLRTETYGNLVNSVVSLICEPPVVYSDTIIRELCYILSGIAIRTIPDLWPTFFIDMFHLFGCGSFYEQLYLAERKKTTHFIADDLEALQEQQSGELEDPNVIRSLFLSLPSEKASKLAIPALQTISCVILEIGNDDFDETRKTRTIVTKQFQARTNSFLASLLSLLLAPGSPKAFLLSIIQNWAKEFSIEPRISIESGLLEHVIKGIRDPSTCNEYSMTFVDLLIPKDWNRFPVVLKKCIQAISSLSSYYQEVKEQNYVAAKSIAITTATLLENYAENILQCFNEGGGALLELALACTAHPDKDILNVILESWYNLLWHCEETEEIHFKALLPQIEHVYKQLLHILLQQVLYEEEAEEWDAEEESDFHIFRSNICDTFQSCYTILKDNYLIDLLQIMQKLISTKANWRLLEAVIYALSVVGECIEIESEPYVKPILVQIFSIPSTSIHLTNSSLRLIREYAEYIAPQELSQSFELIKKAMEHPKLVLEASKAMTSICKYRSEILAGNYNQIYEMFRVSLVSLHSSERRGIFEGLSLLISNLPPQEALVPLQNLLRPVHQEINEILGKKEETLQPILDRISLLHTIAASCRMTTIPDTNDWDVIVQQGTSQHPLIIIVREIWPIINQILAEYPIWEVTEHIFRLVKNIILSCNCHTIPMLPAFFSLLCRSLKVFFLETWRQLANPAQKFHHQNILTSAAFLFIPFSDETTLDSNPNITSFLVNSLKSLIAAFFSTITVSVDPFYLRGFFTCMTTIHKTAQRFLFSLSDALQEILKLALHFIPLTTHMATLKHILGFIELFFAPSFKTYDNVARSIAMAVGPAFVKLFVEGLKTPFLRTAFIFCGNVLFTLKSNYLPETQQWLSAFLWSDSCPSSVDDSAKKKFIEEMNRSMKKKTFEEVVARLYESRRRNTEVITLA